MKVSIAIMLFGPVLLAQENIGPVRLHAGDLPYTDISGQVWAPDGAYAQGITAVSSAPSSPVSNAMNTAFYQSQRISIPLGSSCSAFSYMIPLPNNRYRVTLKLAELSGTARTFTATFNGATPGQTITSVAGSATDNVFYVNVTTGSLNVALTSMQTMSCPVISGIEIVPQVPIAETDVTALNQDLSTAVKKGPLYAPGAVAVIDSSGMLDAVAGAAGTCVLVNGTTSPCIVNFSDGEIPGGAVNGSNVTFTLAGTPAPAQSLILTRNGLTMIQGQDYSISGSTITFVTAATPQSGDLLQAFYRK